MRNALVVVVIVAASLAAGASANKPAGARCWMDASQLAVGAPYHVGASGLPTGGPLNMVVVYPNGNMLTSPVSSADGSYWGEGVPADQPGTYVYKFVGKVSWPSGDWNKLYASCSMQAS